MASGPVLPPIFHVGDYVRQLYDARERLQRLSAGHPPSSLDVSGLRPPSVLEVHRSAAAEVLQGWAAAEPLTGQPEVDVDAALADDTVGAVLKAAPPLDGLTRAARTGHAHDKSAVTERVYLVRARRAPEGVTGRAARPGSPVPVGANNVPVAADDCILSLDVYAPESADRIARVDVLGSQTLAELRNHPVMSCDVERAVCAASALGSAATATGPAAAAFFFIEHVLYDDIERCPGFRSSDAVREWIQGDKLRRKVVGELKQRGMGAVRWRDLHLRLNARYLFRHLRACEHAIVVRDVRLPGPGDPCTRGHFPRVTWARPRTRRVCHCCEMLQASVVVSGDPISPQDPAVLCRPCYNALFFGAGGERLFEHTCAPYSVG